MAADPGTFWITVYGPDNTNQPTLGHNSPSVVYDWYYDGSAWKICLEGEFSSLKSDIIVSALGFNDYTVTSNDMSGGGSYTITMTQNTPKEFSQFSDGTTTYTIKDSTARSELANKQDTLVSGTNIKTINGNSLLGSGNITIETSSTPNVDDETISYNTNDALQTIAVKNVRDDSTLPIWHGTEYQWNHGDPTTWYYWQSDVVAQWVSGTMPSSTSWRSVTYGNGKFLAISNGSTSVAAYSEDGINWTTTTLPDTSYCNFVTYCNGKFMVFKRSNIVACSEDGVNWTTMTIQGYLNWQSIAYGNGKYVVIAKNSTDGAYSEDGINWTAITLPSKVDWKSVAYGNGKFVAVANSSTVGAYSEDGINWTAITLPNSEVMSVTYGNGKFVAAVYNSETAIYSEDGIHWNSSNEIVTWEAQWNDITYGDGKFVAVEKYCFGISTDGINWTAPSTPNRVSNSSVAYGDGKFVAVANGSDVVTIFSQSYDKCYTDTANPTTTSVVYSEPETVSSYTISSVTSGAITLSNNNTYYYNQAGNSFTYRTIGDAHPDWLSNIDNVGVKIGNTIVATAGGSGSSYTAGDGIDITSDVISVTSNISTGASLGTTAVQPADLATVATSGSYNDLSNKPTIPTVDQTYSSSSTSTNALSHKAVVDAKFLQNTATGSFSISILGGGTTSNGSINIGQFSNILGSYNIAIGNNSGVSLNAQYSIALGSAANTSANYAIQLGRGTNSEANSFYVGLSDSNNYKLLSSDGTIPNTRLNVMTGADGTNAGTKGAVPAPTATDNTKFLRGDGTWAAVSGGGSDVEEYSIAEIEALWDGESE